MDLEGKVEGGGERGSNRDLFCTVSTNVVQKSLNHVNNIEHIIKQNVYASIELISLIPQ